MARNPLIINDGFSPELVDGAEFDGYYEIPIIKPQNMPSIPKEIVPFSLRNQAKEPSKAIVCFYEHDDKFADVIRKPLDYIEDLRRFAGVISPDNSVYRDIPLTAQICNIYRNRAVGSMFQRRGLRVYANIRWGDERTYESNTYGKPIAFLGAPENACVFIGAYGCTRGKDNMKHLKEGINAMINTLFPKTIIIYGPLPKVVLDKYQEKTQIIHFDDWMTYKHKKGGANGGRQ